MGHLPFGFASRDIGSLRTPFFTKGTHHRKPSCFRANGTNPEQGQVVAAKPASQVGIGRVGNLPIKIGDFTLFGPSVQILTPVHPLEAGLRRKQEYGKPIEIGSDVWVGGGALILPGVRIGSKTVIGAGSVVTRDVPEGVFAGRTRRKCPRFS